MRKYNNKNNSIGEKNSSFDAQIFYRFKMIGKNNISVVGLEEQRFLESLSIFENVII